MALTAELLLNEANCFPDGSTVDRKPQPAERSPFWRRVFDAMTTGTSSSGHRTFLERYSPTISVALVLLGVAFWSATTLRTSTDDHEELVRLRALVTDLMRTSALTDQRIATLDQRGNERSAAHGIVVNELRTQTATITDVLQELRLVQERTAAELRALREGLDLPQPTYPNVPMRKPDLRG